MKITRIEPTVATLTPKKKVAAYARVSVESDRLNHSLSAQVSYYSNLIQKNPEWIYVGVYADSGISGGDIRRRTEFKRLVEDCDAGKIDIILCKSISRFARNTVDLLETVRHLKSLDIDVWFEKENIKSLSADGELMLGILAGFAEEESRSQSDNAKWSIQKKFERGEQWHVAAYGYRWDGKSFVICEEEAKAIRVIYENFLRDVPLRQTSRWLTATPAPCSLSAMFCRTWSMPGTFSCNATSRKILGRTESSRTRDSCHVTTLRTITLPLSTVLRLRRCRRKSGRATSSIRRRIAS